MKLLVNCFFMILVLTAPEIGTAQVFETTEVVPVDSLRQTTIYQNLKSWLVVQPKKGIEKWSKVEMDSVNGTVSGDFEFLVYSQSGILKKVSGAVSFHLAIETKDFKYRYRYSDVQFHYMKQDRYNQMAKTGKTKSLNETEAKGWQSTWNNHRKKTAELLRAQITQLKNAGAKHIEMKPVPVASVKAEW